MSSVDQGDTVEYVHEQLGRLIARGQGKDRLWIDVIDRNDPADLYAGDDDNADTIARLGVN